MPGDVRAFGRIIEGAGEIYTVDVPAQQARSRDGEWCTIDPRSVRARPSMKMREDGVEVREGYGVALLVPIDRDDTRVMPILYIANMGVVERLERARAG